MGALEVLANAGVISEGQLVSIMFCAVIDSLDDESPLREANSVVLSFVTKQAEWLLKQGVNRGYGCVLSEDEQSELIESLSSCKWLPEVSRKVSLIRCFSLVSDDLLKDYLDSMPSYDEVSSLIAEQGVELSRVLPAWVSISHAAASEMIDPIINMIKNLEISGFGESLSRWVDRSPSEERELLFRRVVSDPNLTGIDYRLLSILGIKGVGGDVVCSSIIDRFNAAGTKQQKIEVLKLWKRSEVSGSDAKKQLIENIFIPCLQEGGSVSIEAIENFSALCSPIPKTIKQRLGELVISSAEREGMEQNHVYDLLRAASYRVKKKIFSKAVIQSE